MGSVSIKRALAIDDLKALLGEIDANYDLNIVGDIAITSVSDGRAPVAGSICFVEDIEKLIKRSDVTYIVPALVIGFSCIIVGDPRSLFIKLLEILQEKKLTCAFASGEKNIHVSRTARIHQTSVIEEDVAIGDGTVISAGCVIKSGTSIGCGCIIRENTVIGCDGISLYKSQAGEVQRFPHLAGVSVGDGVEIGANCVLVRGTLKNTRIGDHVVIGNLCNIGHGVSVADKVWLSVGSLVGGNSSIEVNSIIGIGVTIKDNLTIGVDASVGMGSVCTKSTEAGSFLFGNPAKLIRKIKVGPER